MTTLLIGAVVLAVVLAYVLVRPVAAGQLFALTTPAGLFFLPGGLQLVTAMAVLVIVVVVVRRSAAHRPPLPSTPMTWLAAAWSIGVVWSVALSSDIATSAVFGAWQIVSAFFAVAWGEIAARERLRPVLAAWLLGSLVCAMSGVMGGGNPLQAAYGASVVEGRAVGIFAQPNEYGTYCMMIALVALALTITTRGWLRVLSSATLAAATAGLLLSLSRGAWLGAAVGVVALLFLLPQARRPLALAGVTAVVAAAAWATLNRDQPILVIVLARLRSVVSATENPYDNRPALMAEGIRQFLDRPLLGQGPNLYPSVSHDPDSLSRTIGGLHPHNLVIATGAEQGLVGLAALLGIAVVIGLSVAAARRHLPRARRLAQVPPLAASVALGAGAALIGFVAAGLVDFPMRNALMRTTVWVLIGWVIAARASLPDGESKPAADAARAAAPVAGEA